MFPIWCNVNFVSVFTALNDTRKQRKFTIIPYGEIFYQLTYWDRLSKSGSTLSQSEGQILIDIMNDHGLEQMVHFPTREKNTLDLILTTLPGQFQDVHSPDKLSDHDIVSGTLKIFIPPIKKPRRKVYLYQKGDYESMRKDTLEFAKEKYFNGHSDTRSVQENFDLLTSFIHVGLLETYRYKWTGQSFIWNYIGNWYVFSKYLDNYFRYQYCANDTLFRNISSILRSIFQDILPKKMLPFARQPTLPILI